MEANQINKRNRSPILVWSKLPSWIRNIVTAAIITLLIHLSFAFIARGTILRGFDLTDSLELPFTFFYFLTLFWVYPWISKMVHSLTLSKIKIVYVKFIEGFSVVVLTVLLSLILKLLPLWLAILYINSTQDDINLAFSPIQLRRSFIIYAIIGLFFYYFVERQRIRKQLQKQHLEQARLQKENFKVELENLKNQVDPNFLFKSLNFLNEFIHKNPEKAEEFVNRLSNVYRSFLNRQDELIPLQDEVMQLEDYLYIIKCRFQNNISFKLEINDSTTQHLLPPRSVQTIIENFITQINFKGDYPLSIDIISNEAKLTIEFDFQHHKNTTDLMGVALKNLNERYSYFTEKKAEARDNPKGIEVRLPLVRLKKEV